VFTGIATDDEKIITTDNKYINVLKGEQKDTYKKILLNAINRDVGKDENRSEYDFGWSFWPFVKDDIATGSVFMRINPNYSDVYTQAGQFFTPRVGYDEILSRARSAIDSYTNPIHSDASLLD
jgi:hypothetical protein